MPKGQLARLQLDDLQTCSGLMDNKRYNGTHNGSVYISVYHILHKMAIVGRLNTALQNIWSLLSANSLRSIQGVRSVSTSRRPILKSVFVLKEDNCSTKIIKWSLCLTYQFNVQTDTINIIKQFVDSLPRKVYRVNTVAMLFIWAPREMSRNQTQRKVVVTLTCQKHC